MGVSPRRRGGVYMDTVARVLDNATVMKIYGDADVRGLHGLEQALMKVSKSGNKRVILDLSEVEYIASPALAVLANFHDHFEKMGGRMVLAHLPGRVRSILEISKLTRHFSVFDTVDEALAYFEE
jgi:anti-sigma B factor antagonist